MVTLGKAFPYPAVGTRLELCPLLMNSPSGVGYGASRAYKTAQRLQLQCSGSMHPPRPGHRFSRSLGPLARVLAHGGLRQQGRAGQRVGQKS